MKKYISLLWVLLLSASVWAKIPLPQKNTYVNDFAHVLTKKQVKALNKRIRAFENKTSVQMAVVLVNYLPKGYTIEDYATLIGRKWHVGRANDGLVYVAAIKQHKQRLEVANNLQKYITDERAANVLDWVKISLKYELYYDAMKMLVSQTSVELAEGKEIWTDSEKTRIAEKLSADSLARTDALSTKGTDKFSSNVFYYIVGGFFLMFFWKPLMDLIGFVLGLIVSIFSKRKPMPVDEDEDYDIGDSGIPSYADTRRSRSTSYRSTRSSYSTPLVHHHHTDTLADERRRHEERLLNEERERDEERRMEERRREEQEERRREEEEERRQEEEDRRRENDERSYGNWGKNNDGSRGSSSSTSGFNGGGASSDW